MFIPQIDIERRGRYGVDVNLDDPMVTGPAPGLSSLPNGTPAFRAIETPPPPGAQQNRPAAAPASQAGVPHETGPIRQRLGAIGDRGRQFLDDHPRAGGAIRDFAASSGGFDPEDGPFEAFANGFSNAINANGARRAAEAEGAAEAEQRAYDRGRDTIEDARAARGEERDTARLIADLERTIALNELTDAQIDDLMDEAENGALTPDQLLDLEVRVQAFYNDRIDSFVQVDPLNPSQVTRGATDAQREIVERAANAYRAQLLRDMIGATEGRNPTPGAPAPAGAAPPGGEAGVPAVDLEGEGTTAAPYTGAAGGAAFTGPDDPAIENVPVGQFYAVNVGGQVYIYQRAR